MNEFGFGVRVDRLLSSGDESLSAGFGVMFRSSIRCVEQSISVRAMCVDTIAKGERSKLVSISFKTGVKVNECVVLVDVSLTAFE